MCRHNSTHDMDLTHLIITTILRGVYCYLHFTDEIMRHRESNLLRVTELRNVNGEVRLEHSPS